MKIFCNKVMAFNKFIKVLAQKLSWPSIAASYVLFLNMFLWSPVEAQSKFCSHVFSLSQASEAETFVVREIMELRDNQQIPERLYNIYAINDLARSIVERVRLQEQELSHLLDPNEHPDVNLLDDTDIILFFMVENSSSIQQQGFLNQHLSGESRGTYLPSLRLTTEDHVTGIALGDSISAKKLRPKSAFLNIRAPIPLAPKQLEVMFFYGNVGAVLKEHIKKRALWTSVDSLLLGNPHWGLARQLGLNYSAASLLPYRGTFYRGSLPCQSPCCQYYEALIYGELDLDDVEYLLVSQPMLVDKLKGLGKPIYLVKSETFFNRVVYRKGHKLFDPYDDE